MILLSLALLGAAGGGVWVYLQWTQAQAVIRDNERDIRDKERELKEQRDLIEKKESFGAAVDALLGETAAYAGLPFPSLVPWDQYDALTEKAWSQRWDADGLDETIAAVELARQDLIDARAAATAAAGANASGSVYEATLDSLGSGFVQWKLDDADALCQNDVLACVTSDDPRTVHVDAADEVKPYMTDEIRTGIAYHEFAHVLQFANPGPTATALASFGGDEETMADCFALTFLDGWKLDHVVWTSSREYWEVSVGYGYTCNDAQKQVIRDWRAGLGIAPRQIGPGVAG